MQTVERKNDEKEIHHSDLGEFLNKISEAKKYFDQHVLKYELVGKEYEKNKIYKNHVDLYDDIKRGDFKNINTLKNHLENKNIGKNVLGDVICKIVFEDLDTLYKIKKEEYDKNKDSYYAIPENCKLTSVSISKNMSSNPYWLIDCVFKGYMNHILDTYDNYGDCCEGIKEEEAASDRSEWLSEIITNAVEKYDIDPVYLIKYFSSIEHDTIDFKFRYVRQFYDCYLINKICVENYSKNSFGLLFFVLLAKGYINGNAGECFEGFLFNLAAPDEESIKNAFSKVFDTDDAVKGFFDVEYEECEYSGTTLLYVACLLGKEFSVPIWSAILKELDYRVLFAICADMEENDTLKKAYNTGGLGSVILDIVDKLDGEQKLKAVVGMDAILFSDTDESIKKRSKTCFDETFEKYITEFKINFQKQGAHYTFEEINIFYRFLYGIVVENSNIIKLSSKQFETIKEITKTIDITGETDMKNEKKPEKWFKDKVLEHLNWLEKEKNKKGNTYENIVNISLDEGDDNEEALEKENNTPKEKKSKGDKGVEKNKIPKLEKEKKEENEFVGNKRNLDH